MKHFLANQVACSVSLLSRKHWTSISVLIFFFLVLLLLFPLLLLLLLPLLPLFFFFLCPGVIIS